MGALGAASDAGSSYECPSCSGTVTAERVYSGAALQECDKPAAPPGGARGGPKAAKPHAGEPWRSSAKVDQLLTLLGAIRQRSQPGKPGFGS